MCLLYKLSCSSPRVSAVRKFRCFFRDSLKPDASNQTPSSLALLCSYWWSFLVLFIYLFFPFSGSCHHFFASGCHVFDSRSKPNQKEWSRSIIMSYMSLHTVGMRTRPETRWPGTHPPTDYLRSDALAANFVRHHCNLSAALTVL